MVRKRLFFLLALLLVSFGIVYVTVTQQKEAFRNMYPQLFPSYLNIPSTDEVSLKEYTSENIQECKNGTLMYENFCVISPYNNEMNNTSGYGPVTLCTQGTVEFLQHIVVLCSRWSGPISVAVYSPSNDYLDARNMVELLRQCDSCVRYWVNWHFFLSKTDAIRPFNNLRVTEGCSSISQMKHEKRKSQGLYPINVGRNIARVAARTPFVFSIDIELYPSLYIPAMFERMLRSLDLSKDNQVWVVPVFEIRSKYRAPFLKSELRNLFNQKQAISFHQYRCSICHKIPNLTQWIAEGTEPTSEVEDSLDTLRVWSTVKRNRKFKLNVWEPFFIGTTKDPEFDIRLSWEGKENKMQMAYEMCMRDYDFHIVENAFLVHTPGINVYNRSKEKEREKIAYINHKVILSVQRSLIKKYGSGRDC